MMNPTIPDSSNLTASVAHNFTVYGVGLANWYHNNPALYPSIKDDLNSNVVWGSYTDLGPPVPGSPDSWTFSAIETGSSPGSSTITITVALNPYGVCRGSWTRQSVTYR
jgi:hypothetical protein